jgi:hypothetical protein
MKEATNGSGLITNTAPSLDLVGKDPPVFGRLPERSLGFGLLDLVRQPVALGSLGTKFVWPFHGTPHDFSKPNPEDSHKFKRNHPGDFYPCPSSASDSVPRKKPRTRWWRCAFGARRGRTQGDPSHKLKSFVNFKIRAVSI